VRDVDGLVEIHRARRVDRDERDIGVVRDGRSGRTLWDLGPANGAFFGFSKDLVGELVGNFEFVAQCLKPGTNNVVGTSEGQTGHSQEAKRHTAGGVALSRKIYRSVAEPDLGSSTQIRPGNSSIVLPSESL